MQALSRLRAQELITLSTDTTQVAQKRPPKTFWTSKRPFSTSLYSAALWQVVGTARPPNMGWAPVPKKLGVGSEATTAPRRATSGTSWRGPRRESHHSGAAELSGVPGSKPPQTLQPKLTSPRMGAKNLKPCAGNGNRLSVPKKGPRWPSSLSLEQGTKGFCVGHCWSGCVRLWGTRNFSRVWAQAEGTGYRAPGAEA